MKKDRIYYYITLTRSPIILAPVVGAFYKALPNSPKNILLSYLVLPLVLYPPSQKFLSKARSTSNLRTFCNYQDNILGLYQRVNELKTTTNQIVNDLISKQYLKLCDDLSIEYCKDDSMPSKLEVEIKSAQNLASIIFKSHDIPSIYRQLGIVKL
ncbi:MULTISPECIES: three component ABC system middle component [unclassified Gilliamella]|uniref:three component ABC system middle component n=1 Tax=unclassified Gilliamella TaxID=2685620 RepID=UPI00130B4373|nr:MULTISPECIES: three component ABC system middle component [unclassified Gilliamella]MWP49655.1 hypothetical protein [Gilliamella sp. Lep-s35]MWP68907.1 hypothetical protein [Gilliamella sp. Lep-s5]MWP77552.1 hypothetical protein [Gilliamella sp. Lep-s21]